MLKFEISLDKSKQYRWHLKARNGKIVADSGEAYKTLAKCEKAINLIIGGVAAAKVVNLIPTAGKVVKKAAKKKCS